jgi:hypothetical protein
MSRYFGSGTTVPFREGYRIMKSRKVVVLGPRLVSTEAAPPTTDPVLDHEIAEGVRTYQRLQQQIDKELFSASPDPEVIGSLFGEQKLIRERLAAHGIRVRA